MNVDVSGLTDKQLEKVKKYIDKLKRNSVKTDISLVPENVICAFAQVIKNEKIPLWESGQIAYKMWAIDVEASNWLENEKRPGYVNSRKYGCLLKALKIKELKELKEILQESKIERKIEELESISDYEAYKLWGKRPFK